MPLILNDVMTSRNHFKEGSRMTRSDEAAQPAKGIWSYRTGFALAVAASFLTIWTTIARDDGNGLGFLMLVMAALVSAFTAGLRPAGMARAMLGTAVMQALLGVAVATAPAVARIPDGSLKALLFSGFFTALWLVSAALFRSASRSDHKGKQHS
jgi:hypothetical protein